MIDEEVEDLENFRRLKTRKRGKRRKTRKQRKVRNMNGTGTMAPPLDVDLATIDTSMPLVKDGIFYDLLIEKAEVKPTAAPGGKFIALDMKTTQPAKSMKDEDLGAGVHIFDNVNIVPTGKATWDMIARNAGALVQSAGITGVTLKTLEAAVPQLNGKLVR